MSLAEQFATRSTCERKAVGCVITSTDFRKVLSVGYNGNATGLKNTCDCPSEKGQCGCIHAEINALISYDSPRSTEKIVFTTCAPCLMCAKGLINLGNIKKVIYKETYWDHSGLQLLQDAGIQTEQYLE